jgi:hypothetical protein
MSGARATLPRWAGLGLVIVVALIAAGIALFGHPEKTTPLYRQLQQLAQSVPAGDLAGDASVDLSASVCPLVDAGKLEEMESDLDNPVVANVRDWVVQTHGWLPCLDQSANRTLVIAIDPGTKQCHAAARITHACDFSL